MAAVALRKYTLRSNARLVRQVTGANNLGQNGIAKSRTFPSVMWLFCIYFVTGSSGYCDKRGLWGHKALERVSRR
jgi:hypothetical protein